MPLAIFQTLKKLNGNHGIGGIINALAVTNKTIVVVIHAFLAISAVTILNAVTNAIKSNSSAIEWKMKLAAGSKVLGKTIQGILIGDIYYWEL